MKRPRIHIGTSGWEYPHWKNIFYPKDCPANRHLQAYCEHFATVEVNNSFYRLPEVKTLCQWRENTPDDFIFSIKASRFLSHMKKLKDPVASSGKLLERIVALEEKLGPLLIQLPPHWKFNPERLSHFFEAMPKIFQYVFEFRDPSWHNEEAYNILRRNNASFCIYQIAGKQSEDVVTSDLVYIRLHGPQATAYTGSYTGRQLETIAVKIDRWAEEGKDVYCYFDNDQKAFAPKNAARLQEILHPAKQPA